MLDSNSSLCCSVKPLCVLKSAHMSNHGAELEVKRITEKFRPKAQAKVITKGQRTRNIKCITQTQ